MKIVFLGGCDVDEFYSLHSTYPKLGGKVFVSDCVMKAGGMVANASVVAKSLGADVYIAHELSDFEESTNIILSEFKKYGVNTEGITLGKRKNKKCIIFTEGGERVIFVVKDKIEKITLDEKQKNILFQSDFVYSSISDLQYFEDIENIFEKINENGKKIFIDLDANILENEIAYLYHASVISLNEFGYDKIKALGYDAKKLVSDFNLDYLLLTKGKHGAEVYTKDDCFFHEAIDVTVVDTTGAGDTFNTSFLYAVLDGFDMKKAMVFASYAAAIAITQAGPRALISKEKIYSSMNED